MSTTWCQDAIIHTTEKWTELGIGGDVYETSKKSNSRQFER